MERCVLTFPTSAGIGVQTVTGVVDPTTGLPFLGRFGLYQGGFAALNVLTNTPSNWMWDSGVGSDSIGGTFGTGDISQFNGKICSGSGATRFAILDTQPNIFFGGLIAGAGYISAFRVGEFDITWTLKDRTGDDRLVTIFGGSDLNIDVDSNVFNGTYATTDAPCAVLVAPMAGASAVLAAAAAAGGAPVSWGWDTKFSGRAAASTFAESQGSNSRALLGDRMAVSLTASSLVGGLPIVSAWNALSYTITGAASTLGLLKIAFSGTGIQAAQGTITQGQTSFPTGINPKWVKFVSVGNVADPGLNTDQCEMVIGWTDGLSQGSYWSGEATVGNGVPLTGARYLSNGTVIRCGTPNAASTTFGGVANMVSIDTAGIVTLNWSADDGVAREIRWFALGRAVTPPPSLGGILTQLPIEAAHGYGMIQALQTGLGTDWITPPPTRSRRGR